MGLEGTEEITNTWWQVYEFEQKITAFYILGASRFANQIMYMVKFIFNHIWTWKS